MALYNTQGENSSELITGRNRPFTTCSVVLSLKCSHYKKGPTTALQAPGGQTPPDHVTQTAAGFWVIYIYSQEKNPTIKTHGKKLNIQTT